MILHTLRVSILVNAVGDQWSAWMAMSKQSLEEEWPRLMDLFSAAMRLIIFK